MIHIEFYTKEHCPLCDDAMALLEMLQKDYPCTIDMRDIYSNEEWLEKFHLSIPVVNIDGVELDCQHISFETLEEALQKASENQKA
ncbi:thioredoxin family protein [Virgibacillus phasianinus]|uniref:Thioredoxin family protein n=1 Tax=Virgibacillus phasianinus TaxID=2017483 RepID=A0A220U389_9BACI|nr:glutaredoxin family protein [Virgibacillus phasianinus]ASK62754.1 thioredoxin family protein [Virgibacillus phasianinus]